MINLNRCMLLHLYKCSIDKKHFHEFNGKVFYDNANKSLYQPLRDCRYRRDAVSVSGVTQDRRVRIS